MKKPKVTMSYGISGIHKDAIKIQYPIIVKIDEVIRVKRTLKRLKNITIVPVKLNRTFIILMRRSILSIPIKSVTFCILTKGVDVSKVRDEIEKIVSGGM
jgi:hypothetical protein